MRLRYHAPGIVLAAAFAAVAAFAAMAASAGARAPGLALTLRGQEANNTVVVHATGVDRGWYTIDGGRRIRFVGIRSLRIVGVGGHDICRIVNPRGGLFAPPGGIECDGGNRSGPRRGVMQVLGGRASTSTYQPGRRAGTGLIVHRLGRVVQRIRFSGLAPITDSVPGTYTFNDTIANDTIELVNGPSLGELTLQSATGLYEAETFSNKTGVIVNATSANDDVILDNSNSEFGLTSMTVNATGDISVTQAQFASLPLTLDTTGGSISQTGPIKLGAGRLTATAAHSVVLPAGGNDFDGLEASAGNGAVAVDDSTSDGLTVSGATATGAITVANLGGSLAVNGDVTPGASSGASLAAGPGAGLSLGTGAIVSGENVSLFGDAVSIAPGGVQAAFASVQPQTQGRLIDLGAAQTGAMSLLPADLSAISASTLLTVGGGSAGSITVSAPMASATVPALTLDGTGFSAAGSGALSFKSIAFVDEAGTAQTWTVTPTSVTAGAGTAIPYSGAGALAVTAGLAPDTFDVTASPNTSTTLDGGPSSGGILNYNAAGRTVSGTTTAPSGQIFSAGVEPVTFTHMASVTVQDTPVIVSSPGLACSFVGRYASVTVARPAKHRRSAIFTVTANCTAAASLRLTGTIVVAGKGRTKRKSVAIGALSGSLSAAGGHVFTVALPNSALSALKRGRRESARLTLLATSTSATRSVTVKIGKLKLSKG